MAANTTGASGAEYATPRPFHVAATSSAVFTTPRNAFNKLPVASRTGPASSNTGRLNDTSPHPLESQMPHAKGVSRGFSCQRLPNRTGSYGLSPLLPGSHAGTSAKEATARAFPAITKSPSRYTPKASPAQLMTVPVSSLTSRRPGTPQPLIHPSTAAATIPELLNAAAKTPALSATSPCAVTYRPALAAAEATTCPAVCSSTLHQDTSTSCQPGRKDEHTVFSSPTVNPDPDQNQPKL